ncbi:hypothetical protein H4N58_02855 [Mumia sp. ZJ1417]|uniref:hypothetical protein n=1 Tax=Mumia sp. ZJ1417 TaxID=2708082 RepID=UPI00141D84B6|nr:hypothetical protein [Mumia sp. ZJ1417]QMW66906.1 hypothetical protein H4N58_02855 [Mumia sp. ZJ1417]
MLTRSRRALVTAVVAGLALTLAGCGTGFNAQTSAVYQAAIGTNNRSTDVEVLNALFVKNEDGTATLSAGVVNQALQSDSLTTINAATLAGTPVEVTFEGPFAVPVRRLAHLGTKPQAVIAGDELFAGQFLNISLTFANAGDVEMQVPIVTRTAMYDSVATPAPAEAEDAEQQADAEQQEEEGIAPDQSAATDEAEGN